MAKKSNVNIVMAANAMIENNDKITDVRPRNSLNSFLFMYDNKFIWEITELKNNYMLTVFPGYSNINELLEEANYLSDMPNVVYRSEEINTREATDTFSELYRIIKEKRYDVDKILEEIVKGSKFGNQD